MCAMLTNVKMDAAGNAVATATRAQTHSGEIIDITAIELAKELTRQRGILSAGKALNPVDLENQYTGRVYRLDGQVRIAGGMSAYARNQRLQHSSSLDIEFQTIKRKERSQLGTALFGRAPPNMDAVFPTSIMCQSDPAQLDRFGALRNGDYATVIGKVVRVTGNRNVMRLVLDCHFEN